MTDKQITQLPVATTLIDADEIVVVQDVTTTPETKSSTLTVLKAWIKAYADTLYNALVAPGTSGNVLTSDGSAWVSSSATGAFWTLMPGTPTRASNTTYTATGDFHLLIAKSMVIKWAAGGVARMGMVSIPSTYSAPNTTVTLIGDTMTSIDAGSLKYAMIEAVPVSFAYAGTLGAIATDIMGAFYATEPMRVIGADLSVGTAGTTNNTTVDINNNGVTMFAAKPTLATTVAASPTPFTADSGTSLALNDKITVDLDAVQTTAAVDAYVKLYVFPTRYQFLT